MNLHVLCAHASGRSGVQTPTAPSQPLRTEGDGSVEDKRRRERKDGGGSRRVGFSFKTIRCLFFFPFFLKLHFLTRRCLRDDYQSADTNPADFKLPFNMIRKRVLNLNYKMLRSYFLLFFSGHIFWCVCNRHQSNRDGH